MVFGVLEEDRLKWRGLKIDKDISEAIDQATKTCLCEQIKIEWAEKLAAWAFKLYWLLSKKEAIMLN